MTTTVAGGSQPERRANGCLRITIPPGRAFHDLIRAMCWLRSVERCYVMNVGKQFHRIEEAIEPPMRA
jgi:hypothetical protein